MIDRRNFIASLAMAAGSAVLGAAMPASARSAQKPNILFLFADDHSYEALSAFGSQVQTPNLDRLVQNGVNFSNAYMQGSWTPAVCIATRAMMITGRNLWSALRFDYGSGVERGELWPQYLSRAGYDTYMTGKWHIYTGPSRIFDVVGAVRGGMPSDTPEGYNRPQSKEHYEQGWKPWDERHGGFWEGGKHWSVVVGDEGVDFIEQSKQSDNPFFMYISFNAPHDPRQSPREYVEKYPAEDVNVPGNFLPAYPYAEEIGSPPSLRDERLAPHPRTEYAVRVNRQEYYAIISHMDTQIGRILDALEESGEMDNTYIFFCGDHGLAVGQHGLMGKQNMYEHSVRSPLLMAGPSIPKGLTVEAPVYIQDIVPTTLEIAGMDVPDTIDYQSLLPLVRGEREISYDAIYGAYLDLQRMVRKGDYKLIYYTKPNKRLLFNLREDPLETKNLAEEPRYASIIEELFDEMRRLMAETGDELELE